MDPEKKGAKVEQKDVGKVLREGEVTGHAHRLSDDSNAALLEQVETPRAESQWDTPKQTKRRFLNVTGPTRIVHEEHGVIVPEPGIYEVIAQREYAGYESKSIPVRD